MYICRKCNTEIVGDDLYCRNCGSVDIKQSGFTLCKLLSAIAGAILPIFASIIFIILLDRQGFAQKIVNLIDADMRIIPTIKRSMIFGFVGKAIVLIIFFNIITSSFANIGFGGVYL